jgi:hypothetical protein
MGDRTAGRPVLAANQRHGRCAGGGLQQLKQIVDVTEASLRETLVYKGPGHCRSKDKPWEFFDPAEPRRAPIELPEGRPIT